MKPDQGMLITILVFGQIINYVCGRKINGYIDKVECSEYNQNYIKTAECWVNRDGSGYGALNSAIVFKQDLSSVFCHYRIVVDWNVKNITYLTFDIDICPALATSYQNPLLRSIAEGLRQATNFPVECPFRKEVNYFLSNFTVNPKLLPSFAPKLRWTTYAHFYTDSTKNVKLLKYTVSGRLDDISSQR